MAKALLHSDISAFSGMSNSVLNPFVYGAFHMAHRSQKMFRKWFGRPRINTDPFTAADAPVRDYPGGALSRAGTTSRSNSIVLDRRVSLMDRRCSTKHRLEPVRRISVPVNRPSASWNLAPTLELSTPGCLIE